MAVFEDQFKDHPVHDVLSQVQAALRQKSKYKLDDVALDTLDRLNQGAAFVEQRLTNATPVLNSAGRLNGIQKALQATLNEINQYHSNGNSAHLTNAANQIDAALSSAAVIISISDPAPQVPASEATSFKKLAEEAISQINKHASDAHGRKQEFENSVAALKADLKEVMNKLQALSNSADSKLEELESQFEADRTAQSSAFTSAQAEAKKKLAIALDEASLKTEKIVEELEAKKKEAERIVNLVGNIGLTGNFKGAGDTEKSEADYLRKVALACFSGSAIVVGLVLFFSNSGHFDFLQSLYRLMAALVLLIPGTYAAKESARHRILEARHRRSELELASVGAYLEDLPPEQRHKLKAELTERFFGKDADDAALSKDVAPANLVDLLKAAIDGLSKK